MAEPRRDLPVPIPVRLEAPDRRGSVEYAVNLSPGGACLHAKQELEPGDRVHLTFELPPERTRIEVDAKVVWCTQEQERGDRFCEIGVRFEGLDADVRERLVQFSRQTVDPRR